MALVYRQAAEPTRQLVLKMTFPGGDERNYVLVEVEIDRVIVTTSTVSGSGDPIATRMALNPRDVMNLTGHMNLAAAMALAAALVTKEG
jgi:hypothetical protein